MKKQIVGLLSVGIVMLMMMNVLPAKGYSENQKNTSTVLTQADLDNGTLPLGPDWYHKAANYAQLVSWYQALEQNYSNYLEVFKANELYGTGTITGGYDDYYVRITNESTGFHKPEVFFMGGPHGDETVGDNGLYWFTDWLMRMAFTDEQSPYYSKAWLHWLIDNREIYIEVSHNPYGFDHHQREDGNGWDLNREADLDGPGYPTGGIWASVQGKTLVKFVDNHTILFGLDFHGGARELLYPWGSTHSSLIGISPITGYSYTYCPPDFYFYDAASLRLGDFIGDYGGNFDKYNVGTIPQTVGYVVQGGMGPWAYGANPNLSPVEIPYVKHGPYYGAGIEWISPEMSDIKDPSESAFGNDTVARYGAEVRRVVLHQSDLAQPYVRLQPGTVENNSLVPPGSPVTIKWQVNGSLVVDHTSIQWGTNPDPIHHNQFNTTDYNEHDGDYYGGTGWDGANDGHTSGVTYTEDITPSTSGDYYFVVKAQVDQIYATVAHPEVYHDNPYLRLVQERTNASYHEELQGTDGTEVINGQLWWYSPIIHVTYGSGQQPPAKPQTPTGQKKGKVGTSYVYTTSTTDPDANEALYYRWDWGDGNISDWIGPFASGVVSNATYTWQSKGTYAVKVMAKDKENLTSPWSDPLTVTMPAGLGLGGPLHTFLHWLFATFPNAFPILRHLLGM
ncbi:MAG TPA: M14 family zinc carboxypeptidase [Candidatus Thermoplasmatota archaeon]|nr:M14 family zinc carboxypeptidase [Candidatus Thermoplasmatota archaeon]